MLSPEPELDSGKSLSRAIRKFGWGLSDQALSSLTNFALSLTVARNVSTVELGVFALVFQTYFIALGVSRVFSTDPLVIRYSTSPLGKWRHGSRAATGTAAVIGAVFGTSAVLVGWMIGGPAGAAFVALGVMLPGLLVQDAWRLAFFAQSKGSQAFLNDLIWCVVMIGLLAWTFSTGQRSVAWLIAAWGLAAGVAAIAGMIQAKLLPAPMLAVKWYRRNKDLSIPFLGGSLMYTVSTALATILIGAIAGVAALGGLRAATIILGPTTLIVSGLGLVAVPESARSLAESPNRLARTAVAISSVAGGCALVWGLFVIALPSGVGTDLLGANWEKGDALLIPLTIASVAGGVAIGASSGLKALEAATKILRLRVLSAVIILASSVIGATLAGAAGVAGAGAVGESLIALIWWLEFSRTLRGRRLSGVGLRRRTSPT